jgi:hypothetical protein
MNSRDKVPLTTAVTVMLLLTLPGMLLAANTEIAGYQQQITPLLHKAMQHTDQAIHAASVPDKKAMVHELEQAL